MKTRSFPALAAIFMAAAPLMLSLASCSSYPIRAVQALVGTPAENQAATESPDIIRNEYHAACVREKREAIKEILDLKEDAQ